MDAPGGDKIQLHGGPGRPGLEGQCGLNHQPHSRVDLNPARTYAVVVGPPVMYRYVIGEFLKNTSRIIRLSSPLSAGCAAA